MRQRSRRRWPAALGVVLLLPTVLFAGCWDDDRPELPDSGKTDGASDSPAAPLDGPTDAAHADADAIADADGGATDAPSDAPHLSVADMISTACAGGTCKASQVIGYWRTNWDAFATVRTITFKETSPTVYSLVVTDGNGAPATLVFDAGMPVTLTIVNPTLGTTQKHNLTGPLFYRAAAWRKATTVVAEYDAPSFDAFSVRHTFGIDRAITLYFVPMTAGSYPLYCSDSVTDGNQYSAIVAGTATPDLLDPAGHAGRGMKSSATIQGNLGVTFDPGVDLARPDALSADPRRYASDPVWATGTRNETYRANPMEWYEFNSDEFAFIPADLSVSTGIGYVIRYENPASNGQHFFTATAFFESVVMRKAQDTNAEVEASYLSAVSALSGGAFELFVVPTAAATYRSHCQLGVKPLADGGPNLATGHAGKGMVGDVIVAP